MLTWRTWIFVTQSLSRLNLKEYYLHGVELLAMNSEASRLWTATRTEILDHYEGPFQFRHLSGPKGVYFAKVCQRHFCNPQIMSNMFQESVVTSSRCLSFQPMEKLLLSFFPF